MGAYVATVNVPGYLPQNDELITFETAQEAWSYLADEYERNIDMMDFTDEQWREIESIRGEFSSMIKFAKPDALLIGTPGNESPHDLGLAYSVTWSDDVEVDE